MRLSVSNKYPQGYRLATQGPKIQSHCHGGAFVDLSPKQKFNPKFKFETLEISVVFINPYSILYYSL